MSSRWSDLLPRVLSAIVMVAIGLGGMCLGTYWFHTLISIVCALMIWELVCILDTGRTRSQYILAGATAVALLVAPEISPSFAMPLLLLPSMLGFSRMQTGGVVYGIFSALILFAGYGLISLRDDLGLVWMLWLVLVVVGTDVAGYFAGRMIGGPKLWPRVSPKKTWSGAIAGWACAMLVGWVFSVITGAYIGLIGISVAVSMASQLGDIAESSIKRRYGVKDSSSLIPGHGGVLDRFDGMIGAAVFLVFAGELAGFPPGGL